MKQLSKILAEKELELGRVRQSQRFVLFQQNYNTNQVDKGFNPANQLIVLCSYATKMFQFIEKALDLRRNAPGTAIIANRMK